MGSKEENVEPGIPRQDAFDPAQRPNPPGPADPAVCIFFLTLHAVLPGMAQTQLRQ